MHGMFLARTQHLVLADSDVEAEDSMQRLVAGSPRTVLDQLREMVRATGLNYLLCVFSFGDIAPQHALRSLALFPREVMPKLAA